MGSIKIKNLPEKVDKVEDEDLLVIEDSEDTKKISLIKLKSAFSMDGILVSMKDMLLNKINSFIERHSTRYKELEDRNKQLEVTCHNLENDHIHDSNRIFELENKIIKQIDTIISLQYERENLQGQITELYHKCNELLTTTEKLSREVTENKIAISGYESQIQILKDESENLKNNNNRLQTIINNLEKESNNNIDNDFNEINELILSNVEDLITYIRYYHPDVDEIINQEV